MSDDQVGALPLSEDRATHERSPTVSAVPVGIPSADDIIEGVCKSLHPKLEGIVHQYCDEAYAAIMESTQDYLIENAQFNIAAKLETAERERQYLRDALVAITELQWRPYEFPEDWEAQIANCPECERYRGHPIQRGICDEHRRPIWDREKHESHEARALGPRAKRIAEEAIGGYWLAAQGIEARRAETSGSVEDESAVLEEHAPNIGDQS